jgi:general secretion pathway protein D
VPDSRSGISRIISPGCQYRFAHVTECESASNRQGSCPLNWTGIAGIPVLIASVGLAAACSVAATGNDDSAAEPSITLLSLGTGVTTNPADGTSPLSDDGAAGAGGAQDGGQPPPPTPRPPEPTGAQNADGKTDAVPSAEPLPRLPSQSSSSSARPQPGGAQRQPRPSQRGPSSDVPAAGTQKASPRAADANRQQEIEFDPQGMISTHINELDVRRLLELLSRESGLNILVSPKVKGTITANFEKIAPDELLKSVLKLANLIEKVEGNVHFIYAKEELRDQAETKMKEKIVTKVYRLNYVRADEMMVMISPFLSQDVGRKRFSTTANYMFGVSEASTLSSGGLGGAGGGAGGGGMGGGGGAAMGGAGTIQRGTQPPTGGSSLSGQDVLVIQDYESNLKIIDQIIQKIDVPPVQVLIEAVIMRVELDKETQLGVNFAVVDKLGQQLGTIGSGYSINNNVGFNPAQVLTSAGAIAAGAASGGVAGAAGATATALDPNGFASDTNGIKYGFISQNVTGFVRAIELLGSTKVLASPRILVLNKQRAEIQLGSRLGFKSITTQNYIGTTQGIQFLNTGTLLRLRPFVSDDGMIRMEIHPERSTGSVDATTGLPSAQTAELTTNVMVPNGTTLVIGGLMEDEDDYTTQGLPGLSRLPVLGALFGYKDKLNQRRELVVLLTPHIWIDNQRAQPGDLSARTGKVPPTESRAAGRPSGSPSPVPAGAVGVSTTATGMSVAAASGAEGTAPMATRTGWWSREKAWFRDRRAQGTTPPGTTTPPIQPTSVARVVTSESTGPEKQARGDPGQIIQGETRDAPGETSVSHTEAAAVFELLPAPTSAEMNGSRAAQIDTVVTQNRSQPRLSAPRVDESVVRSSALLEKTEEKPGRRGPITDATTRHHVVQAGESFNSIARTFYGSEGHASLLWWANRNSVPWPEALRPGATIIIPPLEQIAAARLAASPPRTRPTPAPAPARTPLAAPAAFPLAIPAVASEEPRARASADPHVEPAGLQIRQDQPQGAAKPVKENHAIPADQSGDSVKGGGFAIHTVRQNETLQSIASDRLGDVRRSEEIAGLNEELLGKDRRLVPGQRLLLPGDAGPPRSRP